MEFRQVHDNPNYEVSNTGIVRNVHTNRILKPKKNERYIRYSLYYPGDDKPRSVSAHRLVAQSFLENPDNKPVVDHIDGNCKNNEVLNLRWVSHRENLWNKEYKGYYYRASRNRYETKIRDNNGNRVWLGYYATEEEAKRVYDEKAAELRGGYVRQKTPIEK